MSRRNTPADEAPVGYLQNRAHVLRRHMLAMARQIGQGYIGQGLGIADVLAALYFHELRYDPADLGWDGRDRFLLSTGHYSIALWAALAEAGVLPVEELVTYGADDSRHSGCHGHGSRGPGYAVDSGAVGWLNHHSGRRWRDTVGFSLGEPERCLDERYEFDDQPD